MPLKSETDRFTLGDANEKRKAGWARFRSMANDGETGPRPEPPGRAPPDRLQSKP